MNKRDSIRMRFGNWSVEASEMGLMLQTLYTKRAIHSANSLVRTLSWIVNREKSMSSRKLFAWAYKDLKKGVT